MIPFVREREFLIPFEYSCGFSDIVFDTLRGVTAKGIKCLTPTGGGAEGGTAE